ncbi:MAG: AAA family ATPase [Acidimicrobiia bacterium]|nr:AAA family ATPase [Acidimicrobiia bacterium]
MLCMLVVTVANLKGGVGKTTSAICLAQAAAEAGETAMVVDSDPQGSAMRWGQLALDRDEPLSVLVTAHAGADLPRYVESLSSTAVLIDTGPSRSNEDVKVLRSAIKAASLVVVPCQPSGVDLDTIGAALDVCEEHDRQAVVLLTRTKAPTLVRDVRAPLADAGAHVLDAEVPDRASVVRSYGFAPPPEVLEPYRAAWAEVSALARVETGR